MHTLHAVHVAWHGGRRVGGCDPAEDGVVEGEGAGGVGGGDFEPADLAGAVFVRGGFGLREVSVSWLGWGKASKGRVRALVSLEDMLEAGGCSLGMVGCRS